jgi:hypothetical protein
MREEGGFGIGILINEKGLDWTRLDGLLDVGTIRTGYRQGRRGSEETV